MSLENATNEGLVSLASAPMEESEVAEAQYKDSLFPGVYKYVRGIVTDTSKKVSNFIDSYPSRLKSNLTENKENHAGPYSQRQKGFTLTELLITIAITGGLMAILLPSLQRVRKEAKSVVCKSNLHQWGVAFTADEEKTIFQGKWWGGFGTNEGEIPNNRTYKGALLCPMATKYGYPYDSGGYYGSKFKAWSLWGVTSSYGWNSGLNYHNYKSKLNIPVLFDSATHWAGLFSSNNPPPEYDDMPAGNATIGGPATSMCIDRHNGKINMIFTDSTVRGVGLKELWALNWRSEFNPFGIWTKAGGAKPEDWPEWMRKFKDY